MVNIHFSWSLRRYLKDPDIQDSQFKLLEGAPAWLSLDPRQGLLGVSPKFGDLGLHTFKVGLVQGDKVDTATFTIRVRSNRPPEWFCGKPLIFEEAEVAKEFKVELSKCVFDQDGDTIKFTKLSGPAWLSISPTGAVLGTPSITDLGKNDFVFAISDPYTSVEARILIRNVVLEKNDPQTTASWLQSEYKLAKPVYLDSLFALDLTELVHNPNNEPLRFFSEGGPSWLSVVAGGQLKGSPGEQHIGLNEIEVKFARQGSKKSKSAWIRISVRPKNRVD
jgi:hypothetical protein